MHWQGCATTTATWFCNIFISPEGNSMLLSSHSPFTPPLRLWQPVIRFSVLEYILSACLLPNQYQIQCVTLPLEIMSCKTGVPWFSWLRQRQTGFCRSFCLTPFRAGLVLFCASEFSRCLLGTICAPRTANRCMLHSNNWEHIWPQRTGNMVMSRSRGQESSKAHSYIGLGGMKTFIWEDEGGP